MTTHTNRRDMIRITAASGLVLPYLRPGRTMADETKTPNSRPKIGSIGLGGMGNGDASQAARYGDIVAVFMSARVNGKLTAPIDHAAIVLDLYTVYEKPNSDRAYQIGSYKESIEGAAERLRRYGSSVIATFRCVSPESALNLARPQYRAFWNTLADFEKEILLPGPEYIAPEALEAVAGLHFRDPSTLTIAAQNLVDEIEKIPAPRTAEETAVVKLIGLRLSAVHMLPYTFQNPKAGEVLNAKPWIQKTDFNNFSFEL